MRKPDFPILAIAALSILSFANPADSADVTFGFSGNITQTAGPNGVAVGDSFSGTFSYGLGQTGLNVPLVIPGDTTRYVLDAFSLTVLGQTVNLTTGQLDISNDVQVSPTILWDRVDLDVDPNTSVFTGSINGFSATDFLLSLVNIAGAPFSNTALPATLDLADFPDLRRVDLIFANGGGAIIGEIGKLTTVPIPGALWLLLTGLGALGISRRSDRHGRRALPRVDRSGT
jgi:hypothetical protein